MTLVHVGRTSIPFTSNSLGLGHSFHSGSHYCKCEALCVLVTLIDVLEVTDTLMSIGVRSLKTFSACVEVMTTLHGSTSSLRRRAEGCVPPEDPSIRTLFLHVGASEGFQSLYSHSLDSEYSFFSLQLRVHRDQYEFEYGRTDRIFVHSLDTPLWVRVEGRLVRYSERSSMDQQDETLHDSLPQPPPPPVPTVPQASPYVLHGHSEVAPPVVVPTTVTDDAHARMDRLEQRMRQMRVSDGSVVWDDFEGMPVASLPVKFRMPDIERYTGIGCPRIHLRLYNTVMRAHGLDESQMITLFPLSLSGATQRWFASLESSRRRTWDDLA
ncbi:hypothetical protein AAG906_041067 [Vitis piasezkii]